MSAVGDSSSCVLQEDHASSSFEQVQPSFKSIDSYILTDAFRHASYSRLVYPEDYHYPPEVSNQEIENIYHSFVARVIQSKQNECSFSPVRITSFNSESLSEFYY